MPRSPCAPSVADQAPSADVLTQYDSDHLTIYLRILDAEADGAEWTEVAQIVLGMDAAREPERARIAWESHLKRARWLTEHGYRDLVRSGAPH